MIHVFKKLKAAFYKIALSYAKFVIMFDVNEVENMNKFIMKAGARGYGRDDKDFFPDYEDPDDRG